MRAQVEGSMCLLFRYLTKIDSQRWLGSAFHIGDGAHHTTANRLKKSQASLKPALRLISNESQAASEIDLRRSQSFSEIPLRFCPLTPLDFEITNFLTSFLNFDVVVYSAAVRLSG